MINYIEVGKRIKKLREDKGLSQEELANKVESSSKLIYQIEIGINPGDECLQIMFNLALALDTSLEYLFRGTLNTPTLRQVINKKQNKQ